jgi:stress responsive alpha/beta barrel protein
VIRHVVLGRLGPDADPDRLEEGLAGMRRLHVEGLLGLHTGRDAGLREGNWDYAITADLLDAEAYRRYDADEEHNRIRREYLGPLSTEVVRCQFEVPGSS